MSFDLFVAVVGTVLGVIILLPQLFRLRRHGSAGLSPASSVAWALNLLAWVTYGVASTNWALVAASAPPAVFACVLAVLVCRSNATASTFLLPGLWAFGLVAATFFGGWYVLGLVLGFSVFVSYTPQVVAAWRQTDLSGVSPLTWSLAACEGVLWLVYGAHISDPALLLWGVAASVASAAVLVCWWRRQRFQEKPTLLEPAVS